MLPASVDDLRGELKKAEEAIDELQAESVVWRKSSRSLSKEVENLRQQLAEAMKQDQMAEMEIQNLVDERDYLTFELEKSQVESETKANEISELKEKLKDTESDLVVQKAFVARLTLQAKSQSVSFLFLKGLKMTLIHLTLVFINFRKLATCPHLPQQPKMKTN